MKILIVEDNPSLQEILGEIVKTEIPEAEICLADNLNDAVEAICSSAHRLIGSSVDRSIGSSADGSIARSPDDPISGILCDGTFPTWAERTLPRPWNHPAPNWVGLAGWAEKKHIPLVVLTGAGDVAEHACRVGVPVFMKPLGTHDAIAALAAEVRRQKSEDRMDLPGSPSGNPVVNGVDLENERLEEDPSPESRVPSPEPDATGEP